MANEFCQIALSTRCTAGGWQCICDFPTYTATDNNSKNNNNNDILWMLWLKRIETENEKETKRIIITASHRDHMKSVASFDVVLRSRPASAETDSKQTNYNFDFINALNVFIYCFLFLLAYLGFCRKQNNRKMKNKNFLHFFLSVCENRRRMLIKITGQIKFIFDFICETMTNVDALFAEIQTVSFFLFISIRHIANLFCHETASFHCFRFLFDEIRIEKSWLCIITRRWHWRRSTEAETLTHP